MFGKNPFPSFSEYDYRTYPVADAAKVRQQAKAEIILSHMWYSEVTLEEMADAMNLYPQELNDKIYGNQSFTDEEYYRIQELLHLTEKEMNEII